MQLTTNKKKKSKKKKRKDFLALFPGYLELKFKYFFILQCNSIRLFF